MLPPKSRRWTGVPRIRWGAVLLISALASMLTVGLVPGLPAVLAEATSDLAPWLSAEVSSEGVQVSGSAFPPGEDGHVSITLDSGGMQVVRVHTDGRGDLQATYSGPFTDDVNGSISADVDDVHTTAKVREELVADPDPTEAEDEPSEPEDDPSEVDDRPTDSGDQSSGSAGLQGDVGPNPSYRPEGDVTLAPGDLTQSVIDEHPDGTRFVIEAGVHRLSEPLTPKADNAFLGEPGAVISGSKVLSGWRRDGATWVIDGQTQRLPKTQAEGWTICSEDSPFCDFGEDVFLDGGDLRQVGSVAALQPGTFYFDYDRSRIHLADDPTGRSVETTVSPQAFVDGGSRVTFRNLIIEKFGGAGQQAAIRGDRLTVERNEFRQNHGPGISQFGGLLRGNSVHHNGQIGITGGGTGMLVEGNEIAYNNTQGFDPNWEAGGTKWAWSNDLTVRNNWSHHNGGSGLWTDIDNVNTRYEGNLVEDNDLLGISHEISYDAVIKDNVIRRNGHRSFIDWDPVMVGILITNSSGVEVTDNVIEDNAGGTVLLRQDRRIQGGDYGEWTIHDNNIHDNVFRGGAGMTGIDVDLSIPDWRQYHDANNRFSDNVYEGFDLGDSLWWLEMGPRTFAEWRAAGQD